MDLLLYDILDEVNWYFKHKKSMILPISYPISLKETVRLAVEENRESARKMLIETRSLRKDIDTEEC